MSLKFNDADIEDVVDIEPFCWLLFAPKLGVLLCAESSPLLVPLPGGITSDRPLFFFCCMLSCGVWCVPDGVAKLNFGGCLLGIANGGNCDVSAIGGAAELFTGRWFGEGGIESPNFGILPPTCDRCAPGIGGRSSGAGDAILDLSGGVAPSAFGSATVGRIHCCRGRQRRLRGPPLTACYVDGRERSRR